MEKCHSMTKGLEKAGVKTHSIGLSDTLEQREYIEKNFLQDAAYTYEFGSKRKLYQGNNYFTKILNNLYVSSRYSLRLLLYAIRENVSFIIIPTTPIEVTLPTLVIGKIFGINVVTNIMEYLPVMPTYSKRKNILNKWSWKLVLKKSDAFIVISDFLYKKILKLTNKKQMILPAILPEFDSTSNVLEKNIVNRNPIFVYTSSSGYEDLLDFTLDSLAKIKNRGFELVITGNYPESEKLCWVEKISRLELNDKVRFSGFLSGDNLMEILKISDALLIPLLDNDRHKARFPQKVLGYMQLGKPVITTGVGELANYFKDGETMIMDNSVTVNGFSEKIVSVLDCPGKATKIGANGKIYVEDIFNMEAWGHKLKVFLQDIK